MSRSMQHVQMVRKPERKQMLQPISQAYYHIPLLLKNINIIEFALIVWKHLED